VGVTVSLGIISDTHGLVRPEAIEALRGCDRIVHAGDVGGAHVIEELEAIAPVIAVRGNNDHGDWARKLPDRTTFEVGAARIHVIHDRTEVDTATLQSGPTLVVSGHSHRPSVSTESGIVFLNPGSAGPRRFRLPISLARCEISGGRVAARIVTLESEAPRPGRA
jgi:putative phosphoesterase